MSDRITRAAARSAAQRSAIQARELLRAEYDDDEDPEPPTGQPVSKRATTKRKARASQVDPGGEVEQEQKRTKNRNKRQKLMDHAANENTEILESAPVTRSASRRTSGKMSTSGPSNGEEEEEEEVTTPVIASKKKASKGKKTTQEVQPSTPQAPSRKSKKTTKRSEETMAEDSTKKTVSRPSKSKGNREPKAQAHQSPIPDPEEDIDMENDDDEDPEDRDEPFSRSSFLNRNGGLTSFSQARAMLGGLMPHPGTASRLRGLLSSIRDHADPTVQTIAMEELSDMLLVSNEDNLNGQIAPDLFAKELVTIMSGGEFGTATPEMMELACRCIANLLEALPSATHPVVASGVIPVLCEKLTNMEYMEAAEQAMTTLSKIADEFPGAIVREGGLLACLRHLDFFTTYMQKQAVTVAAKCCYDLSDSSFDAVLEVMPTLQNVLSNSDKEVVKQAAMSITRIVNRFGYHQKLEKLVTPDLLKAVFSLLMPGTSNIVGDDVQTRFLGMLSTVARASPKLTVELLKNDVVDIIYQFLTGVSPPEGDEDIGMKIDGVLVMQALIHKPRDQIFGALNVIYQILPEASSQAPGDGRSNELNTPLRETSGLSSRPSSSLNNERIAAFETCKDKVRRFVMILLPTLTHAYDITVNLNVRSTVLDAQLKMLSNIDSDILESALRTVPFASFLASILSQEDHNNLVLQALRATELLLERLKPIYAYQFCREGVLAELKRLSEQKLSEPRKPKPETPSTQRHQPPSPPPVFGTTQADVAADDDHDDHEEDEDEEDDEDETVRQLRDARAAVEAEREYVEEFSGDESSEEDVPDHVYAGENTKDQIILKARKILATFEDGQGKEIKQQAEEILSKGRSLVLKIQHHFHQGFYENNPAESQQLFTQLAEYFSTDPLKSISSAELFNSDIIEVLLDVLDPKHESMVEPAHQAFAEAFMKQPNTAGGNTPTALNIFIHKLQDLLSRKEHLEVVTVHNNSQENTRMDKDNLSYQLGKQIRIRLEGMDASEIPSRYRNIMVSIHAIATFKSLNDYLRPRMALQSDNLSRSDMLSTLAALTGSDMPHRHRLMDMERALAMHRSAETTIASRARLASAQAQQMAQQMGLQEQMAAQQATQQAAPSNPQTPVPQPKKASRRSSRRRKSGPPELTSSTETPSAKDAQEPLECADERNLEDEDELDEEELNTFVEDLEDELDDEAMPDPRPVSFEVAATGKVTARSEDGTRIATPSQGTPSGNGPSTSQSRPASRNNDSPRGASNTRSYAAAVQSTPQDWHLEFSLDGKPISLDTTIYRAVHVNRPGTSDTNPRSIWSSTHTIKYKKVSGPPKESVTLPSALDSQDEGNLPDSLHKNPIMSKILRLLDLLHDINANVGTIMQDTSLNSLQFHSEAAAQFVNTKLTAKLNRQLEEPLVVASRCLPQWSEDLVRLYPFLFPFEARYLYLQSEYFGYHRAIERWTHAQADDARRDRRRDDRPYLHVPKKQKVRISRDRFFDSAVKVLDLYASSNATLEVEYFDEVGTGLGPTMEFYSVVSKEFAKKKHKLWREDGMRSNSEYVFTPNGLFPAPMSEQQLASTDGEKVLSLFRALGKFVARSLLDSRMIDVSFNPIFFRGVKSGRSTSSDLAAIKLVDKDLANSLRHIQGIIQRKNNIKSSNMSAQQKTQLLAKLNIEVESLMLDMTLPGYSEVELLENGRNIDVTAENINDYFDKVISFTMDKGVSRQIQAFRAGFSDVFSYDALKAFTSEELVMIFGRSEEDWSIPTLIDSIKADHGFNIDSLPVKNLIQVMSQFDEPHRRLFLQFVTGSPKLPIGGFNKLMPTFTVVLRKDESGSPDEFLPSVMTCTNYLKLPDYSTLEIMRQRINQAIKEGQGAFHLS